MKKKLTNVPTWKLNDLFKDINDPNISRILKSSEKSAITFSKKYRSKLAKFVKSADSFLEVLKQYESILQYLVKPLEYAQLRFSVNQLDPQNGAFLQKMRVAYTDISKNLMFFELEIQSLPKNVIKKLISNKKLAGYSNYLKRLSVAAPHRLSESEEKLLSDVSLTGKSAWVRLFGEEQAAMRYPYLRGKKIDLLSDTEILDLMMHKDRAVRKNAAKGISKGLSESSRRLAYIFNTLLQDKQIRDRYRKYQSPEESRHEANQISQRTVDSLTKVVVKNYKQAQAFYGYKANLLGIKDFSYYDRLAPVGNTNQFFTYQEAKDIILTAFYKFSGIFGEIAECYFRNNWIDAKVMNGKRGGAFCSFGTPDLHPYVFMNYRGSLRDVFTLAHELGHAIHASLMANTTYLNFNIPLTIAEVASTFAELLVFEELLERTKNPNAKKALYVQKIDSIIATVFRQISMYKFEKLFHDARNKLGEQTPKQINELWLTTQHEFYGNSVKLDNDYAYWWSYIPHFINSPFYVYAYAFGDLMALSLFKQYKKDQNDFVLKYINFLSAGDAKSPDELVKPMKLSLNSEKFWQDGMDVFKTYLQSV
jgi:oligoendopeptidase F